MQRTVMERSVLVVGVLALLGGACGGAGSRVVVNPRQVDAASGAPKVRRVTDLGDMGAIPASGNKLPRFDSDGVFVVGELVLVEGDDFGKLPTVNIGGRPAVVLARTGSGGIVTRIPPDVASGTAEVEVSHTKGRGAKKIEIRRYGFVVQPGVGKVYAFTIGTDGTAKEQTFLSVAGAKDVAYSSDGAAAYVAVEALDAGERASVEVIATTTAEAPKAVRNLLLRGSKARLVSCAAEAPVCAVVGGGYMTAIDTRIARNPSLYEPVKLGADADGLTALGMAPDGRLVVLLNRERNTLVPYDLSNPRAARRGEPLTLLPDQRVPLITDFGFAPGGKQVWVLSGDNREALIAGSHPARLLVVTVNGASLSLKADAEIAGADAPTALAVARRESIMGATAIRSTARRAAVVVAGVSRDLLRMLNETGKEPLQLLGEPMTMGQLVRTDLEGKGQVIWSDEAFVTDVEMSHDVRWLVASTTKVSRAGGAPALQFGVLVLSLSGGKASFLALGDGGRNPLARASIALSP